jgi:hypothetical protein
MQTQTMQTKEFESPSLLPTLDALEAEFGRGDEQCADGCKRQGGASMARFEPTQYQSNDPVTQLSSSSARPSLRRRASRRLARFLVVFGFGAATTLAWQSYGDAARALIATSSPQLEWLAPQSTPAAQTAVDGVPAAATASPNLQQLALGLASVRMAVDQLTDQLTAGQRQVAGDIAKLQADEQELAHKLLAASRPPAPARKPAPPTPPAGSAGASAPKSAGVSTDGAR